MSEHTPGPWEIDDSNPEGWLDIVSADDGKVIGDEGILNNSFLTGNAYLIRAAPDMYEALKDFLNDWNKTGGRVSGPTLDKIDAAIAKAGPHA